MYGAGKLTKHQMDVYSKWLIWRRFKLMPWRYRDDKTIYWDDIVNCICLDEFHSTKQQEDMKKQQHEAAARQNR